MNIEKNKIIKSVIKFVEVSCIYLMGILNTRYYTRVDLSP